MNKTELIKKVSLETGFSQADVRKVLDASIGTVVNALAGDKRVAIQDFGTFSVVTKPARRFHNVYSGETAVSDAHPAVKFQPSQVLKNAIK